jgi:hypothetical protein
MVGFSKKWIVLLSLVGANTIATAQIAWPTITQQAKPWTRWWWLGSQVNNKDLTTVMQQYRQAGLGGLEITPIYGVQNEENLFLPFLTKEWMAAFDHTLSEGKRLDLGIDLANATGWPFGGPWTTEADACKYMAYKNFTLNEGETLSEKITYQQEGILRTANGKQLTFADIKEPVTANADLQKLAFDQVRYPKPLPLVTLMAYPAGGGRPVNLTKNVDATGSLNWKAPAGKWNLYAVFMGWHGKQVERAAPGGEGNVIDHFSAAALQHYLQRFDQAFAGKNLSGLRGYFNDSYEVDDARGQSDYTPLMFEEFKKRRGYDLQNELPALFGKDTEDKNNRVLFDYRATIDELILEKFTKQWASWAKKQGKIVRNQSHGSPANTLDLYSAVDIPETEGTEILRMKFASSAGHVSGKPLISSESSTWLGEHFVSTLADVKKNLDVYLAAGINHIFYHGTVYSPPSETWPGRLFYAAVHFTQANPFWDHFGALNQYVARCQSFLQTGKPDNDVLVYYPIYDKYMQRERALLQHFDAMKPEFTGTDFEKNSEWLQAHGYGFDFISDRQLQTVSISGGKLLTSGTSYQTILLPGVKHLPLETLQKLDQLAKAGATILVYDKMPTGVPGYGMLAEKDAAFKTFVEKLKFDEATDGRGMKQAISGKGKWLVSANMQAMFEQSQIRHENLVEGINFTRRKNSTGNIYFIANTKNEKQDDWITLSGNIKSAVLYNPMTGEFGIAQLKSLDGNTQVKAPMGPGSSYIIQTSSTNLTGQPYPYINTTGESIDITGTWTLRFEKGGPNLPASRTLSELKPWTSMNNDSLNYFSGIGSYSIHFAKPTGTAKQYVLQLEKVYESAEVFINGKKLATLLGPDYSTVIAATDLKADNLLEVKIANSMANCIIDLEKRGVKWKKFYNTNFPSRLAPNRGADGLFTAASWEPRKSGMEGKVTLLPIQ